LPTVHRAIFGEVKGAHDLIIASSDAPESVLTELAARYTDRLLPAQISWKPYVCGLPIRGHYVVTRTFPVKATRSGMVQTHAVIVPLSALDDLTLERLLNLLPTEPQTAVLEPSVGELSELQTTVRSVITAPSGYLSAVHMLLNGQVPIWLGQDNFEDVVRFLWQKLWPEARQEFRFRISAEPNDLIDSPATLVCTPVELRTNWKPQQLVDVKLEELPDRSLSEAYLLGLADGDALKSLRMRLGFFPSQLSGLKRLEQYVRMLDQDTSDSIRSAVRLMKTMFPEPDQCEVEKASLLEALVQKTVRGTEEDVIALRNLDGSSFFSGPTSLHTIILKWLNQQIEQGKGAAVFARTVLLGNDPWKHIADKAVSQAFRSWSINQARLLWHWWTSDSSLIVSSEVLIPRNVSDVESDLMRSLPASIPSQTRTEVLRVCSNRRLYLLSGSVLRNAADMPAVDKFRAQLSLLADGVTEIGLSEMANGISAVDLVNVALTIQDKRIVHLAGQTIRRDPELLGAMDASDPGWRAIWASALDNGHRLFDGVSQPAIAARAVFEAVLNGSVVQPVLVEKLACSPSSNLIAYEHRRELMNKLSPDVRREAVSATAEAWLSRFSNEFSLGLVVLEPELEQEVLRLWRSSPGRLSPVLLPEFWQRFASKLTEADFENWLSSYSLQLCPLEAISLGKLILENDWNRSAKDVIRRAKSGRNDLLPTVRQLWASVDLWDKMHFAIFTNEPAVKDDEWWAAFFDLCIRLYQYGIQQNDIWTRADGDGSRVKSGTGRDEWGDALGLLRKGGAGGTMTVEGLLHQMRQDFYHNPELQLLENVYHSKIKARW
jgi:hypothetical protein